MNKLLNLKLIKQMHFIFYNSFNMCVYLALKCYIIMSLCIIIISYNSDLNAYVTIYCRSNKFIYCLQLLFTIKLKYKSASGKLLFLPQPRAMYNRVYVTVCVPPYTATFTRENLLRFLVVYNCLFCNRIIG